MSSGVTNKRSSVCSASKVYLYLSMYTQRKISFVSCIVSGYNTRIPYRYVCNHSNIVLLHTSGLHEDSMRKSE